ncbi:Serine/threonine-protein kinase PknD [compost metagenome]
MRHVIASFLLAALLLSGCRLPSLMPQTPGAGLSAPQAAHVLQGRIKPTRQVQAELPEIAEAATVGLIDGVTGYTAATTVTADDGSFVMVFQEGFAPVEGRPYYLEAIKGIKGRGPNYDPNDLFNQAGADAVRLRTVIYYLAAAKGWISPYNAEPGPIYISRETTTLSLAIFLKKQVIALDHASFIGCLSTDVYVPVPGLTTQEFDDAYTIVNEAITQDRDPVQFLAYDSSTQGFLNLYNGHAIDRLIPASGAIGDEVTIMGDGFNQPGELTVRFNGVEAFLIEPPAKDRLKVRVPVGARSGPVSVRIGTVTQGGSTFTVNSFDGHRAMLDGALYVANYDRARIVKVDAAGVVSDFATVPAGPTQVALYAPPADPNKRLLFVSCETAGKIVSIDLKAGIPTAQDFVVAAGVRAMAFQGSVLYVAKNDGTVSRYNLNATSAGADLPNLPSPTALAFDYAGNLYVALDGDQDRVRRVEFNANGTVKATQDWAYVSDPQGLSVDSGGALYIASAKDDLVYRVLPNLSMSVFARVPNPSSLMLDESGYLFVASDSQHQIYRVSPLGDIKPYAFGISHPRGVAVDASGRLYVSLSQSNAVLKVEPNGGNGYRTLPFLTGIANPHSVTWRNNRLYVAHREAGVISSADASGNMRTEATGLTLPGGVDVGTDGKLYVGRYGTSSHAEGLPPNVPWHDKSDNGGIDIVSGSTITTKLRILRTSDRGITGLNDGTRFAINSGTDQLVAYQSTNTHASSFRYRVIKSFGADPLFIERDATGANLFVTVSGRKTVYRFTGSGATWAEATFPELTAPTALSYDSVNDRLYVKDGDTFRRFTGATTGAPALDNTWSATVAGVTDIAYKGDRLYMVLRTAKELRSVSTTVNNPPADLYVDGFSIEPYNVVAHPTQNYFYLRTENNQYVYRVDPAKVIRVEHDYTGWARLTAYGIAPDAQRMIAESTYPNYGFTGKSTISSLIQSHEVAFHNNRVYVGSFMGGGYTGVYAYNLDDGTEMHLRGTFDTDTATGQPVTTGTGVLAVNPDNNRLYVGSARGKLYFVDIAPGVNEGQVTFVTTLSAGDWLYGLDITAAKDQLWAVGSSRNLYSVRLSDNGVTTVQAGLSRPRL